MKGTDIHVQNKHVGTYTNDLSNVKAGIKYKSVDGKTNREFEDLKGMMAYLVKKFGLAGDSPIQKDE
jgi:hypothetical protein